MPEESNDAAAHVARLARSVHDPIYLLDPALLHRRMREALRQAHRATGPIELILCDALASDHRELARVEQHLHAMQRPPLMRPDEQVRLLQLQGAPTDRRVTQEAIVQVRADLPLALKLNDACRLADHLVQVAGNIIHEKNELVDLREAAASDESDEGAVADPAAHAAEAGTSAAGDVVPELSEIFDDEDAARIEHLYEVVCGHLELLRDREALIVILRGARRPPEGLYGCLAELLPEVLELAQRRCNALAKLRRDYKRQTERWLRSAELDEARIEKLYRRRRDLQQAILDKARQLTSGDPVSKSTNKRRVKS